MFVIGLVTVGIIGGAILIFGGVAYLISKARSSQPIAELRRAFADFEAAQRRDDTAAMARHAADVRRLAAGFSPSNTEATGYVTQVALAGY
jgi:hypothetical protein